MKLYEQFIQFMQSEQINPSDLFQQEAEEFVCFSFPDQGEDGFVHTVTVVFYKDDESVEILVRKPLYQDDELTALRKANSLNEAYRDECCVISEKAVALKHYFQPNGNINIVLKRMLETINIARQELVKFR